MFLAIVNLIMEIFTAIGLLFLGVLGNSWFWTSYTNRVYSLPIPSETLDKYRIAHDIGILTVPFALLFSLIRVSMTSHYQIAGIALPQQNEIWLFTPWLLSGVGLIMLSTTLLKRFLRSKPPGYSVDHREIVHTEQILGQKSRGEGPYQKLLRVPGNQAFSPEFNEKTFTFDRLPAEFSGTKLLHISDVHFLGTIDRPFYELVFEKAQQWSPDMIVFTGDLLDRPEKIEWIDTTFGQMHAPLGCYYILGNHDWHLECDPIRERMAKLGWQLCGEKPEFITKGSGQIAIAGDERPWMGNAPQFDQVDEHTFRMLLSHTPDNIKWARQNQIDFMLSGHNHGGQIKLPILGPVYSPSRFGVHYADGVFHEPPTTLHVTRGVSGKHPLRIGARPEISLLNLERRSD